MNLENTKKYKIQKIKDGGISQVSHHVNIKV